MSGAKIIRATLERDGRQGKLTPGARAALHRCQRQRIARALGNPLDTWNEYAQAEAAERRHDELCAELARLDRAFYGPER